jgi:hypothetical protein
VVKLRTCGAALLYSLGLQFTLEERALWCFYNLFQGSVWITSHDQLFLIDWGLDMTFYQSLLRVSFDALHSCRLSDLQHNEDYLMEGFKFPAWLDVVKLILDLIPSGAILSIAFSAPDTSVLLQLAEDKCVFFEHKFNKQWNYWRLLQGSR